ncbi:helicase-related protein, partial [Thermocrinis sp.]
DLRYTEKNLIYFLFLLGYYEGLYYGKSFGKVELVKYDIGEASDEAGRYKNADLIFIHNHTLYVLDFKLAGAQNRTKSLLERQETSIPFRVHGVPVNLSLGEMEFEGFLRSILNIEEKLKNLQNVSPEIKGFLQVVSYAVDYLCETSRGDISEVYISLIYPLAEPFVGRFFLGGKDLRSYRTPIKELYKRLKESEWVYAQAEEGPIRRERLLEEAKRDTQTLKEKIKELESKVIMVHPDSIKSSREDVKKRIEEFFQREEKVKALCLLHSAGSGKTSQTRERILKKEGNHIVLYFATRKVLLDREEQKLIEVQKEKDLCLIYEKRNTKTNKEVKHYGDVYEWLGSYKGIIKRVVEEVSKNAGKHRFIWALLTQQAITQTLKGRTSNYLSELTTDRILDQYTIHIILDEFLGHSNGLFAVEELLSFLQKVRNKGGRANLYLFDANGYTSSILEKLLREYSQFKVMPPAIMLCDYKERDELELNGIKIFVSSKHGYPSPKIMLKRRFFWLEGKKLQEEWVRKLVDYIVENLRKDSTALLYLQHKQLISETKFYLEQKGISTLVATADSRKSQERINKGKEDILLATSAISRGIDLSRPHKPVDQIFVVVLNWGIEESLVELLQTISRARGDAETEERPKEVHLLYFVYPISDRDISSIAEYLEEDVDKEVIEALMERHRLEQVLELDSVVHRIIQQFVKSPEEGAQVLVPIPKQYGTNYIPNELADVESVVSFLENLYHLTKDKNLWDLVEHIYRAICVSAVKINFESPFTYYHPYILFERQDVRFWFDEEKRRRIYGKFKSVEELLKEHNPDKTEGVEVFLKALPATNKAMPVLIPVYSYVLTKHFLKNGGKIKFSIGKSVGRGGAEVLMGGLRLSTFCISGTNLEDEYACIPMGEDYPYKEVLSGRFAKFPVEFIVELLEGADGRD